MSISAWYDVWCDADECIEWTAGGHTRKEAAIHARQSGWRRERDGWKCPEHQRKTAIPKERQAAPKLGVGDGLDELRADAQRWRDAEAEGHIVDFSEDGFGLQHPPSCRPDLIGCRFNQWLAVLAMNEMPPGRYRMTWGVGTAPDYTPFTGPSTS